MKYRNNTIKTLIFAVILLASSAFLGCEKAVLQCAAKPIIMMCDYKEHTYLYLDGNEYHDFVLWQNDKEKGTANYKIIGLSEQGMQNETIILQKNYFDVTITGIYLPREESTWWMNTTNKNDKTSLGKDISVPKGEFKHNAKRIFFKDYLPISGDGDGIDEFFSIKRCYLYDTKKHGATLWKDKGYVIPEALDFVYEYAKGITPGDLGYDYDKTTERFLHAYSKTGTDKMWPANVLYYLNYPTNSSEDDLWATNGYYWIDFVEPETTVDYIPENPQRNGYVFGGWYKEPECLTPWNFQTDKTLTLQTVTVETDIALTFKNLTDQTENEVTLPYTFEATLPVPTKLYAKWTAIK